MTQLSSLRARLASFEHAYTIAARLYGSGVRPIYVVRTTEPLQPVRVTGIWPDCGEVLTAFL
jgi:hypothetical protein